MKKLTSLLFAVLTSTMMFGQVTMNLNVIGRVDANPRFTFDGEKPTFNWANSCVYTQFETSINDKWTILLVNHWASSGEQLYPFGSTPDLYKSTWMSDSSTWVDFLYVDYKINDNWSVRAGKDVIAVGGFEYDDWDWDVDYDLASYYWLNNAAYQWGVSGAWTNNAENTTFRLQAVSSPYSYNNDGVARPWYKGIGSYYFQHDGSYGIMNTRNAIGFVHAGENVGFLHTSLGFQVGLLDEALTLGTDVMNEYGVNAYVNAFQNLYTAKYEPSEKWEILGKFGWQCMSFKEIVGGSANEFNYFGGVSAAYFPLRDKKDLRIQATVACNPFLDIANERSNSLSITIGATYNLPIHIL